MPTSAYANLLLRPDLGKKAYRLRCRFRVPAKPSDLYYLGLWRRHLEQAKYKAAEWFVADMKREGWEYVDRFGFAMKGPFIPVDPVTLHRPPRLTARQMLPGVMRGERFLDDEPSQVQLVRPLAQQENWEYELAAVFVRKTILTELPDPHEEKEMLRHE